MTNIFELNLDGLVGPTRHYAGLSYGNLASIKHAQKISNPQAAALQGLAKMRLMHSLGLKQGVLPPHPRPNYALLTALGYTTPAACNAKALLSAAYSASSMWAANAATVSSSRDTADHRVHFTPANLVSTLHRHQEANFTASVLQRLFADTRYFVHHKPLPSTWALGDEGAANHSRLCQHHAQQGLHLFVYGRQGLQHQNTETLRFPARQTLEASEAIARTHQLNPQKVFFACQNPAVINQGVFHNDVIAVANESVLLVHEEAYVQQPALLAQLSACADFPLNIIQVPSAEVSVREAVQSYLFNARLVTTQGLNSPSMSLIAPSQCREHPNVHAYIQTLLADTNNPINSVHYLDLHQSMQNGGGPACLRLRVPLTRAELAHMHQGILITPALLSSLEAWVKQHYRTQLLANDLTCIHLEHEVKHALEALTEILDLDKLYE